MMAWYVDCKSGPLNEIDIVGKVYPQFEAQDDPLNCGDSDADDVENR